MAGKTSCECCINYVFDEECDYFVCDMDLDEDEMVKFLNASCDHCPYFQYQDEYKIVRKQM